MIGQRLGHFHLLEKIGAGGMGEVYRAHDEHLDRDVAIKVLPTGVLADEEARRRFRNEALALSKLNHPHIATVYDFDVQDGVDFLVMEYVAGASLGEKVAMDPLPEKDVSQLGEQIAAALQEAHEHGLVHRDLKPSNVMVTSAGKAKVLDFGLARLMRPTTDDNAATAAVTLTQQTAGTLPYMAPEQLRGEPADVRTDIHALGAVLYEMATGRRPFDAKLSTVMVDDILHKAPEPPRLRNARLSAELERIILKCLEKEPDNRYQSAKELAVDLRRLRTPTATVPVVTPRPTQRFRPWSLWVGAPALAVLVGLVAFNVGGLRDRLGGAGGGPQIQSLAVLPLVNLSGDPQQEYFADGMTEALTADLARLSALRVISRTSAMRYKGTDKSLPDIARELKVDAVVEGSVQHSGGRVRITAQLVHAPTDKHLWAETYERDFRDVLALQSDVARAIASQIRIQLTAQEQAHLASARPVHPEAHEAYLLGRYHLNKGTREGAEKAIEYFEESHRLDPNHARAFAGVAQAYNSMSALYLHPGEALPKAKAAAMKALELDPSLAEAHASLGIVKLFYEWDWPGAERSFRRALELDPNSATAHLDYGFYLAVMGRQEEASREGQLASSLDPLSRAIQGWGLFQLYVSRRYDKAIEECGQVLEVAPNFGLAYSVRGLAYATQGRFPEAIADGKKATSLSDSPVMLAFLADIYAMSGKRAEAETALQELLQQSRERYVCQYSLALIYVLLGDADKAFEWLNVAFQQRND